MSLPLFLVLAGSGCSGDGGNTGGGSDAGNNGSGDMFKLTVTARATQGFRPSFVYAYVGDATITRAEMAAHLNENAPLVGFVDGAEGTETLMVPAGKQVTVIAVETGYYNINVTVVDEDTSVDTKPRVGDTELTGFEGDFDVQSEDGVVALTMNRDRAVTATYAPMTGIVVKYVGCSNFDVQWSGPPFLGFGTTYPNEVFEEGTTFMRQRTQTRYAYFIYDKSGTNFSFMDITPSVGNPNSIRTSFVRWEGGSSSGPLTLVMNKAAGQAPPELRSVNTYLDEPATVNGAGCGFCQWHPESGGTEALCAEFASKLRTPG